MLEEYQQSVIADRVTLLRSFETGKEFSGLSFPCFEMKKIFRSKPVGYRASSPPAIPQALGNSANTTPTSTWAARLSTTGGNNTVFVSRQSRDLPPGAVLLNAAEQRIDAQLPSPSRMAWNSWHQKTKRVGMRYCRSFHLHPDSCDKDPDDCYSHGPLSEEEKFAFRHELRREKCYTGLQCRDPYCFYGHNCSCDGRQCKLPLEMHNVDIATIHVSSASTVGVGV